MQQWEYHIVMRERGVTNRSSGAGGWVASDFVPSVSEMAQKLSSLGLQGWELVGLSPRQGVHGETVTTEEMWVFKRPVS